MRDRRPMEIIEVLSPDDASFADTRLPAGPAPPPAPAPFHANPRARLLVGAGVLTVIATVIAMIALDPFGTDDRTTATTVPTTESRPRRQLAPEPDGATSPEGRFVLDAEDIVRYSADVMTPKSGRASFRLWGTGNPSRPWISVQATPGSPTSYGYVDAVRRVVDGMELITPASGADSTETVLELQADTGEEWTAVVHGSQMPDDAVIRFTRGLRVVDDTVVDTAGVPDQHGLSLIADTSWEQQWRWGAIESEMRALTAEGELLTLQVSDVSLSQVLTALPYYSAQARFERDGRTTATFPSGDVMIVWEQDHRVLALSGNGADPVMLGDLSRLVRPAEGDEFRDLVAVLHPDYRIGNWQDITTDTWPDGRPSVAGMQLAERGGRTLFLWWWTSPEDPDRSKSVAVRADLEVVPEVDTIVVRGATYVFIAVPASFPTQRAQVTAADGTSVEVPLQQVFDEVPVRVGAVRVDAPGQIDVRYLAG